MASKLIKPKNNLKVHLNKFGVIADVSKIVRDIPNLQKIKNDLELLKYMMSIVENSISKKVKDKLKADEIVFEIFCELFPSMTADEKDLIKKNIEYLVNNNQVEKIGFVKKNSTKVWDFFLSKPKN